MTDYEERTRNDLNMKQLTGGVVVSNRIKQRRQTIGSLTHDLESINSSNYFKQRHNSQQADQPLLDAYSSTVKKKQDSETSPQPVDKTNGEKFSDLKLQLLNDGDASPAVGTHRMNAIDVESTKSCLIANNTPDGEHAVIGLGDENKFQVNVNISK